MRGNRAALACRGKYKHIFIRNSSCSRSKVQQPDPYNDRELAKKSTNYKKFATDAFSSLYEYSKIVAGRLPELHVPIRIIQSKGDKIVDPESANIIYERVSSQIREIIWFKESGHEMMRDMEAQEVFERIMEFVLKFRA